MKKYINQYVDGCNSCQRVKPSTAKPFGALEPLPIPAGPRTNISYDMITDLPESKCFDCILTVIDRLTKMAHFLPCSKTMSANQLANLMLKQVGKLHRTPKTIISNRGSIFVSHITSKLNRKLGIQSHPSTAYHPRTEGQSKIANKVVEQYLRHFVQYRQDNWEPLLALAEFTYNNSDHSASGVSLFKANYGFNPTYSRIPLPKQCIPTVEARLRQIEEVQSKLTYCLGKAQETMKRAFDRGVRPTPQWRVGDKVCLSSKNISTTRPSAKMDHRWLGPFPILSQILASVYKLTLPLSMKTIHPVFHVSVFRKYQPDTIEGRVKDNPCPVVIRGEEEWEVEEILDKRKRRNKVEYLVSWKGFVSASMKLYETNLEYPRLKL
jgi:hypothetical protein